MPIKRAMGAVQLVISDYEAILRMSIFTNWWARAWLALSAATGSVFIGLWYSHVIDGWNYHAVVSPVYSVFGSAFLLSLLDWMKPPEAPNTSKRRAFGMGFIAGFFTVGMAILGTGYFLLFWGEQEDHYLFKQTGAWMISGSLAFLFGTMLFAETSYGQHWVKEYQGWAGLSSSEAGANNAPPTQATPVNDSRISINRVAPPS